MKRLFLIFLFLLIACPAWGATYYVCKGASPNYVKYSTTSFAHCIASGTDAANISELRFTVSNGDTMILDGGKEGIVWSGNELDSDGGITMSKNITIRGCNDTDAEYMDHGGTVTIDGSVYDDNVIEMGNGGTVGNMTIKNSPKNRYGFYSANTKTYTLNDVIFESNWRHLTSFGTVTANRCTFKNASSAGIEVNHSATSLTLNYPIIRDNSGAGIVVFAGTLTINNAVIIGNGNSGIYVTSNNSQSVVINNSIITANMLTLGERQIFNDSTNATVVCNNCILNSKYLSKGEIVSASVTVNNPIYLTPRFLSPKRVGIVSFVVDDSGSDTNFDTLATLAETYGMRIGWAVSTAGMTEQRWALARDYVKRGHDIISHGVNHVQETTLDAATLATELSGSKTAIEANIPGFTCRTHAYPGAHHDTTVKAAVSAAGYIGARGSMARGETYLFSSMKKFSTYAISIGVLCGKVSENPTETQIRQRIAGLVEYLNHVGGWVTIYMHNGTDEEDMSAENMAYVFDELSKSNIKVMTSSDAIEYVIAHAESTTGETGEIVYTRSEAHLGDASDYHLRAGSPAVNHGIFIQGLTTDFESNLICGLPDIGAYERQCYFPFSR